jgi:methionyl-tRNA formyltransferase
LAKKDMEKKIIFMGTPEFAVASLQALLAANCCVKAVFTAPDRPAGRGQQTKQSAVKELALASGLAIYQPVKIRATKWLEAIKEMQPDVIVVAAYGQIIPQSILDIPQHGCINVHASLLPKYRGASPIHFALLEGATKTGVTIMKMDAGIDTGPILSQREIPIKPADNLESLHDALAKLGADLLVETLPKYLSDELKPRPQDESQASYTKILQKKDGQINWQQPAENILNMIRAFNPWPGTFTQWEERCLKIMAAELSDQKLTPGEVKIIKNKLYIGTHDQALMITKLQQAGKNCLLASEFVKGCPMIDGYYCH